MQCACTLCTGDCIILSTRVLVGYFVKWVDDSNQVAVTPL